jgi:hypothetical protein
VSGVVSRPPRPLAAAVRGFSAWQFGLMLAEPVERRIGELQRRGVHPEYIRQLREQHAELVAAGEMWQAWQRHQSYVDATDYVGSTQIGTSSERKVLTPEEVGPMLGVGAAQVRNLLRTRKLRGERSSRFWLIDLDSVTEYLGTPRGEAA